MLFFFINLVIFTVSFLAILFLVFKKIPQMAVLPEDKKKAKDKQFARGVGFVKNKTMVLLANAQKVKKQKIAEAVLEKTNSEVNDNDYWKNVKEI